MNIAVTGGSGFIGKALTGHLQAAGHHVTAISIRNAPARDVFAGCDAVVNLAGEPVAQRWTAAARERIRNSRVEGTRKLVAALREQPPRILVSASAIGYYGSRGDEVLTEDSQPAADFLAKVCVDWEREAHAAEALGVRVVTPRLGVVLGPNGGALAQMLLPFKLGVGGRLGTGRQCMSWIHLDDVVSLIEFAIVNETLSGPVNATAPTPVTNAEFTRALATVLHRPAVLPVPAFAVKLLFGEMSQVILGSQRAIPEVASRAGFSFRYSEVGRALAAALGSHSTSGAPNA
jgi:uncharacterized protein (TIGR01777 family)